MEKILLLLLISFSTQLLAQENSKDTTVTFKVFGNCAMCKKRIETASRGKGVKTVDWNIETKMLTLEYDPSQTNPEKVQQRIADVGHDTELKKAKDYVYKDLPECCLYRDGDKTHSDEEESKEIMGVVMEVDGKGNFKPLKDANILLNGTNKGVATNDNGYFKIGLDEEGSSITISYVGFQTESIKVSGGQHLNIVLNSAKQLQEVKIVANKRSSYVSPIATIRTQVMTDKELFKAACCNLSESFETSASVDVSYNDAVTGSKQIQLLGLSGNYTQLTLENLPGPRGLAIPWGLSFIPGTWVESIQLSKGVGSVANGFESIAGQINVELKKPENSEQLFANAYINSMGKTDVNLDLAQRVSKKWSTALLVHDDFLKNKVDFNNDKFRDLPTGNLFTLMNRWKYDNNKGLLGQIGGRILIDNKTGGEMSFDPNNDKFTTNHYGLGIETKRYEGFAKIGYVFPEKKYKSFGLQLSAFHHNQDSYFGLTAYNATQNNFYSNFIYQSIIGNTDHKFRTGISFVTDNYNEIFRNTIYKRTETVPGAFFEYTYTHSTNFSLEAGIRGDRNNLFGFFVSPRLHIRYEPVKGTTIRLSGGRGERTANIFAENLSALVSSRTVNILNPSLGKAYGLDPEIAWNEGITLDQKFNLFNRAGTLSFDFFRTDFKKQVVVDLDNSARQVNFYNLSGKSFSNSFQTELSYELLPKLDVRLAYRLFDVKATYHGQLLERPLLAKNRAFANLAYQVNGWKFDYTVTYNGTKRIPYTGDDPSQYQLAQTSPSYFLMNAQITKTFGNKFPVDVYVGGENLANYYQRNAIIAADQPFSTYFDASLIWGPVSGRLFYGGVRLKIK